MNKHKGLIFTILFGLFIAPGNVDASSVTTADRVVNFISVFDNSGQQSCVHNGVVVGQLSKDEIAEHIVSVPSWHVIRLNDGTEGCVRKSWSKLIKDTSNTPFEVYFLDVGTGEAAIINIQDREIIIDGGNYVNDLHNYIRDSEIIDGPIELGIVTHADSDHWKGFVRLLNFDGRGSNPRTLQEFWEPGYDRDCYRLASYETFIQNIRGMVGDSNFHRPLASTHTPSAITGIIEPFTHPQFPGVTFTLLYSEQAPIGPNCPYRINNASIVLKIEINGVSMLFTGDANGKNRPIDGTTPQYVERSLLTLEQQHPGILKVNLIKVPHHGSETVSTQEFIDAVDPQFAIISASTGHHLPRPTVVNRYEDGERIVLSTDANRERMRDHIFCQSTTRGSLSCNFQDVLE